MRKFQMMEIVQTGTSTWQWCISMVGARFAVFVRRARVLPSPCPATRNLSFWRFHRHRHPVVSTRCSLGWYGLVRKFHKMEIAQTCTGTWQWCISMFGARFAVFVRRARVLPSPCFNLLFHWPGMGWCENSTRWKSHKRVQARGDGAWACLAHGLQCLCDGRACCPDRALQLVICRN